MKKIKPTSEQTEVIDNGRNGNSFIVDACAGSGKTSTLNMTADEMPDVDILYVVYNKPAQLDAKKSFPSNVDVRTTSSLAWAAYKDEYSERMKPGSARVPASETAKLLGITEPLHLGGSLLLRPVTLARMVVETVDRFAYTADLEIKEKHVSPMLGLDPAQDSFHRSEIVRMARKMWTATLNPSSKLRFTMDYAWKLYVLGGGRVATDCIMLDEAQDSNSVTELFVKSQDAQTIVVGDPAQQLYGWRGARNIMSNFEGPRLSLSQSWRFGQQIAEEANKWLAHTEQAVHVLGNPALDSKVSTDMDGTPDAVLCRTNGAAMAAAMGHLDQDRRVAIVGGTKALKDLAFAAGDLRAGKPTSHPELVAFSSWTELVEFTEEPGGGDLKALVGLVNRFGSGAIIDACNQTVEEEQPTWGRAQYGWRPPEVVISTAHKAKGREWGKVTISDDFDEPDEVEDPFTGEMTPGPIPTTDAMLHYVAVTRARKHLNRLGLAWVDKYEPVDRPAKVAAA